MEKNSKNISTCDETSPKGSAKLVELKQKKLPNKWQKRFAVGCLAVLMCGTALFGVACTPATSGTQGANPSSSANGGGNLSTNTSPFGLDPANDPVVYTTAGGLEIKCSNALTNTNLASYTYFTMGEYNGTPVNWVIIGYDPSVSGYVGEFSGESIGQGGLIQGGHNVNSTLDNSPMGNAIRKEFFAISSEAKPNDEIGDGCVLVLSEKGLGTSQYGSNTTYNNSSLQSAVRNLYYPSSNLNSLKFNEQDQSIIIAQQLTSSNGYSTFNHVEYLFPLGYTYISSSPDTFDIENYFNIRDKSLSKAGMGVYWWLRSGKDQHCGHINPEGTMFSYDLGNDRYSSYNYIRPAFVMKLA